MDGSNSGVQHLSLAFRDPIGAAAVNVLPCDRPADIYQMVADKTIATLKEIVKNAQNTPVAENEQEDDRPSDAELAQWWLDFGITRKTCKTNCMIFAYGSKQRGMGTQILEEIVKAVRNTPVAENEQDDRSGENTQRERLRQNVLRTKCPKPTV
ncbi:DNA-directed RNA polymerase [Neptuniibacter sp. PT34_22]|uniref:DNA-directed RNA polymerase n=1 Tax=Neptuniibacter sp. PT34_22 TaxID=3398205 RepID=UPI0039F4632F